MRTGKALADAGPKSVANRMDRNSAEPASATLGPTVSTGHWAWRKTSSATEPNANFVIPPRPCVPRTNRSTSSRLMSEEITSQVRPRSMCSRRETPLWLYSQRIASFVALP
jgi:hypothetical protein